MKQYVSVSTEEHTVLIMQIYIDSLAHENPIINYRYADINRLPSMRKTYYNGNRMRPSHIPFTKKTRTTQKNLSFNYKQVEERKWDKVLQKAKYSLRGRTSDTLTICPQSVT